jgi:hypothetical protein
VENEQRENVRKSNNKYLKNTEDKLGRKRKEKWKMNRDKQYPKRRHINFTRRGITQKKAYNKQYQTYHSNAAVASS